MVAVVIPYYNEFDNLVNCLKSISNSSIKNEIHVFIVDNSEKKIELNRLSHKFENLKLSILFCKARIGYGRACNVGTYTAIDHGYDLIVISNQDLKFQTKGIENLINPILNLGFDLTFPMIFSYDFKTVTEFHIRYYISLVEDFFSDLTLGRKIKQAYPINAFNGSCFAVKSDFVKSNGLFDPLFFMYGEDNDLYNRLLEHQKKIGFVPSSHVGHLHSNETATGDARINIEIWKTISLIKLKSKNNKKGIFYLIPLLFYMFFKILYRYGMNAAIKLISNYVRYFRIFLNIKNHNNLTQLIKSTKRQIEKDKIDEILV